MNLDNFVNTAALIFMAILAGFGIGWQFGLDRGLMIEVVSDDETSDLIAYKKGLHDGYHYGTEAGHEDPSV